MTNRRTVKLGDIGIFFKGAGIPKDSARSGDLPAVRYGELYTSFNVFIREVVSGVDQATADASIKISKGDILFAGSGETIDEIGKSAVYQLDQDGYAGGDIIILRPDSRQDASFLAYVLNSEIARKELRKLGQGQSVVHIYRKDLESLELNLPEKPEQERIVRVLEVWDEYIEKLERKIARKEQLKKGLMRELLTGRKRLPGFHGRWTRVQYGDLCTFQSGFAFSSSDFSEVSGLRLIRNRDLKGGGGNLFYVGHPVPQTYIVENGDILVGMDGDFIACNWSGGRALLNQRVGRLINFNNSDPNFIFFRSQRDLRQIENETSSTTVKHLSAREFEKRFVTVPGYDEQVAIGHVLSSYDKEIDLLTEKRGVVLRQKKYLLKNLITGKIRTLENLIPKGAN